jgi:hypothetical protein
LGLRAVLFPLDFFYWKMSQSRGYDPDTDTWTIEGVCYSANALRDIPHAEGEVYRVTRNGRVVVFERIIEANQDKRLI